MSHLDQAKRLVRRRLLDTSLEAQRSGRRRAAEADVHDERALVEHDVEHHVAASTDHAGRNIPDHACRESGDLVPQRFQGRAEQQVVLEAPAAAAVANQFLLD